MKRILLFTLFASALAYGVWYGLHNDIIGSVETDIANVASIKSEKDRKIEAIMERPDFKQKAQMEAERWYYKELIEFHEKERTEAIEKLEGLDEQGFQPEAEKAAALQSFLESKNAHPDLIASARDIVQMDRWIDIVAIIGKETSYCTAGVGKSRNNCGAIKRTHKEFRQYDSKLASLKDMEALLQKPLYRDKTIAEMNGTYCVNEVAGSGPCPGWTEHIELAIEEIKLLAYAM